jgi:hypothetical protein
MNKNWFVYAADNEFETFSTEAEAIAVAKLLIPKYLVNGVWEDGVDEIKVGCFTHQVSEIDRPQDLDEHGCDREGNSWGDLLEYKCNYDLVPNLVTAFDVGGFGHLDIVPHQIEEQANVLVAKVPICVRVIDDDCCGYEAYRSLYGKIEGSTYQKGDRFTIKMSRSNAILVIDLASDWILIPNSELSCFDRMEADLIV